MATHPAAIAGARWQLRQAAERAGEPGKPTRRQRGDGVAGGHGPIAAHCVTMRALLPAGAAGVFGTRKGCAGSVGAYRVHRGKGHSAGAFFFFIISQENRGHKRSYAREKIAEAARTMFQCVELAR